jgi:hypothetical protein
LDADVDELLNGSVDYAPVDLGGDQLDTPCIEKRHFQLRIDD